MTSYSVYSIKAGDDLYVGVTKNTERRRIAHNGRLRTSNWPLYRALRQSGATECILEVQAVIDNDTFGSETMKRIEQHWINALGATLNVKQPHRDPEEVRAQKAANQRAYYYRQQSLRTMEIREQKRRLSNVGMQPPTKNGSTTDTHPHANAHGRGGAGIDCGRACRNRRSERLQGAGT